MNKSLFRKSSLDRISSPEQLNDYIRVSTPSIWLILGAILVMLVALLVWAVWGEIPSETIVSAYSKGGIAICYLPEEQANQLQVDMVVACADAEHTHEEDEDHAHSSGMITNIASQPISYEKVSEELGGDEYLLYALNIGEWNVPVSMVVFGAPDGVIDVSIVTESIHPIDFLLN